MTPYTADWIGLMGAELDHILLLLRARCAERLQAAPPTVLWTAQIEEAEARRLLAGELNPLPTLPLAEIDNLYDAELLWQAWAMAETTLAARFAAAEGRHTPLAQLTAAFNLTAAERRLILLLLGVELNPAVGRLLAYLQGEAHLARPTVHLALQWFWPEWNSQAAARRLFDLDGPLSHYRLAEMHPPQAPLRERQLFLTERIVQFLLGQMELDGEGSQFCRLEMAANNPAVQRPSHPLAQYAAQRSPAETVFCYLHGARGSGRLEMARLICQELARPLLIVDGRHLLHSGPHYPAYLAYLRREMGLWNAALYLDEADLLMPASETEDAVWTAALKSARRAGGLVFLAGERRWQPREQDAAYNIIPWSGAPPDEPERLAVWRRLTADAPLDEAVQLPELAARFRFTAGKINDVWQAAYQRANLRDPERPSVSPEDLYGSAFVQSTHQLHEMAQRIPTVHDWNDIALPTETLDQLHQIVARTRHLHKVYYQWGFTHKISSNRGLVALFTGPSGTGKTMAASIVARDLGLEMYRVDLSAVVSKYVGETEKNLGRIFDEAWRSNAIIFFDEADALFGKRSEVRDSHDRYANIEVNYLLQRIDSFDGVAILATNLSQNIDDAFQRRIQFTVNFPMPEVEIRRRIWSKIWPPEAPLAADVDLQFLAEQFRFSGGAIRNVALQAAFLAADAAASAEEQIEMRHILEATLREIRKSGKLISAADFGPYAEMLSLD